MEAALAVCIVKGMEENYLDEYAFAKIKASVAIRSNRYGEAFVLREFLRNELFFDRDKIELVINDKNLLNELEDQAATSLKKGNGCFIATATFDGEDHPTVLALRNFRDTVLKPTVMGRAFIWFYYRVGPVAGKIVRRQPLLKNYCRAALTSLSKFI